MRQFTIYPSTGCVDRGGSRSENVGMSTAISSFLRRDPAEVEPWAETCGQIRPLGVVVYVPRGVKHKAVGKLTVLTVCIPRGVLDDIHEVE